MFKEALPKVIEYYVDTRDHRPFCDWLDVLSDAKAQALIQLRIDRLALGNFGHFRPLGEGIFELKIDTGPGYRVYFGLTADQTALLLCGGDKRSQVRDIQRAKNYWKNYRRQQDAHER